ncbi:hypothetical protein HF086_008299 [Spodoptera exigua]|uniref:PH domain-containing protein n=1 Tax=Spodoptera exigua TaxID=7107 RepID=A0A922MCI6_SPOEX|nr:hypothetical protein HF086_008299 [Spodoptera exigua]
MDFVFIKWSSSVSELAAGGAEAGSALARACLALEPLALSNGKLLARLDRLLANAPRPDANDTEEPEYKKIDDVLYEHLLSTMDAYLWYSSRAGSLVGVVESVRRRGNDAGRAAALFDSKAPIPLAALLLRPLHRALHYHRLAEELYASNPSASACGARELSARLDTAARAQLQHGENHAALCQLQRDLAGEDINLLLSATNDNEYTGWYSALSSAIENARDKFTDVDTELTPYEQETECPSAASSAGGGLAHVCWHRFTSLDTLHLHLAMRTQLSGYLLRKFKKSPGWQKLWVVFAISTLFFYKSWQDETPLASLPLLGYSVGAPTSEDNIDKDFVFKLQFKNHVYFFRADSLYTFNRWTEVLQTATMRPEHN